jgi:hypothetical protein
MSIKLNTILNAEVSHSPSTSTITLSGKRTKPPAQAMNLQAVAAEVRPKLWKTVRKIMASLALGTAVALVPMVGQARPIMTWNVNGQSREVWERIFETMNAPGGGVQPIEVAAIQEAGRLNGLRGLGAPIELAIGTPGGGTATAIQYEIQRGGATFRIYWTLGGLGANTRNAIAIVLRNPRGETEAAFVPNPNAPRINGQPIAQDDRPALGVRDTNGAYYFTFHARARGGTTNNAAQFANAILDAATLANDGIPPNLFIGADVNRDLTNPAAAFPDGQLTGGLRVVAPAGPTFNARRANPDSRFDGFIVNPPAQGNTPEQGVPLVTLRDARTARFPSDHFPVAYDDNFLNNAGIPVAIPVPVPPPVAAPVVPPAKPKPKPQPKPQPQPSQPEPSQPETQGDPPGCTPYEVYIWLAASFGYEGDPNNVCPSQWPRN